MRFGYDVAAFVINNQFKTPKWMAKIKKMGEVHGVPILWMVTYLSSLCTYNLYTG